MKMQLKTALMKRILLSRRGKHPFNEKLAELYSLPEHAPENWNNSHYYSGHTLSGESLYARLGLRSDGSAEVWFAYRSGDVFYSHPTMEYDDAKDSPLTVTCVDSGKEWAVSFDGIVADQNDPYKRSVRCQFSGTFLATDPIFDFAYHINPTSLAAAMAREHWSRELFQEMQENSQTHYEQNGRMTGTLVLDGKEIRLEMPTVRDHSYGKRDWNYMNKHMWLMALLDNGDMINISMVSYPAMKRLDAGNVIFDGKTISLVETIYCEDMENDGKGPDKFHIAIKLENGRRVNVYAERETEIVYPMGGGGYILREGLGSFTVDGKKARGILEFGFNQDRTRW